MIHKKKMYMQFRIHGIGPGGWKCSCCRPSQHHKKKWCKMRKKLERAYFRKYICEELK